MQGGDGGYLWYAPEITILPKWPSCFRKINITSSGIGTHNLCYEHMHLKQSTNLYHMI